MEWPEDRGPTRHARRDPKRIRDDVDEEICFHLEARAAELEREGLSRADALREAERQFGDVAQTREALLRSDGRRETRVRWRTWLSEFRQDVVYGARQLGRRPGFAAVAVLTLAIGIGANTAIFSAADHVLLRPLPYANAERVVTLWETDAAAGVTEREVSPGNFLAWRERSRAFSHMGLAEPYAFDVETPGGPPQSLNAWLVTADYFEALGVEPVLGAGFPAAAFESGGPRTVMISYGFWQRRFASDPSIVGEPILLDGQEAVVAGVLPPGLAYPDATDLWMPKVFRPDEALNHTSSYMVAVGRLAPGVSAAAAQADLDRVAAQLAAEYPRTNATQGVNVIPLTDHILGDVRPALLILLAAVGFVLLIACANVAGLLLARGAERERELAVRAALGAGRRRLLYQLGTESLLLALIGGALGVAFGWAGVRALTALAPPDLPRLGQIAVDLRVLSFAAAVTLLTAVLFGVLPSLRFSRPEASEALRVGGRSATPGRGRGRLRAALVAGEIALALVLLIGAGLLLRSWVALVSTELGFEPDGSVAVQAFIWDGNPTEQQRVQRANQILARFEATPGVEAAALGSALPFHPGAITMETPIAVAGRGTPVDEMQDINTSIATGDYFRVMGIPLVAGRTFDERDRAGTPFVAVINESFARRFFAGEDPIGRRLDIALRTTRGPRELVPFEIIGVVGDVRPDGFTSEPRPELWASFAQQGTGSLTFVARVSGDAADMVNVLREQVWAVDPAQSVYHAATLESLVADTVAARRFSLLLLGVFSIVALALAAIGLYGLISYSTGQRTSEIGVRMALGAERRDIVRMIVREGLVLALPGIALGLLGAALLSRLLAGMLYGVEPIDPLTFAQLAVLVMLVAGLASWLPARRAVRRDPVGALREG